LSLQPVAHSLARELKMSRGKSVAFVADAVHGDDATAFHEEPDDARVQFADVP
jgi:hypothetical protein